MSALAGCFREEDVIPIETGSDVIFSVNIPGNSTPATRALGNSEESEVKTIEMLLFNPQTKKVASNPVYANIILSDTEDSRKKTFTVRLPEGQFDMMVFANSRKEFAAAAIHTGDEQEAALADLTKSMPVTGWTANPAQADKAYLIPMWGMKENLTIGQGTTISGIYLHRMLSRIDLRVTGDDTQTGNFKLKDIKLYNLQKQGRIAPKPVNWDAANGVAQAPSPVAGSDVHPAVSFATVIAGDEKSCTGEMYAFEAPKATADADLNAPFLTVLGEFNGVEGWYRIDLTDYENKVYLDILRNHLYKIGISKVTGTGFLDEDEAISNRGSNISVDVTLWNEYDMGETVFDGQHFLSISPQDMELTKYVHTDVLIEIKTDTDSEISASGIRLSASPSDLEAALPDEWIYDVRLTPKSLSDGKRVYNLFFNTKENNSGGERTGYVYVKCGRLTNVVRIVQLNVDLVTVVGVGVTGSKQVPAVGGPSGLTGIPPEFEQKLSLKVSCATVSGVAADMRSLVRHAAVLTEENGAVVDPNRSYSVSTKFRVSFPKIYWPNREVPGIIAIVTFTLNDGTTKACAIHQTSLTPKAMQAHNYRNGTTGWGNIVDPADSYCAEIITTLKAISDFNVTGWADRFLPNTQKEIPAGTNYLHTTFNSDSRGVGGYDWGQVNAWWKNNDGLLMITTQHEVGTPLMNYPDSPLKNDPVAANNYPDAVYGSPDGSNFTTGYVYNIYESSSTKRVYRYIMQYARNYLTAADVTGIYGDGIRSTMPISELPASAVVMIYHPNVNRATLIIDLEKRFIYCGEMSHFDADYRSKNRELFTQNLVKYMENVTRYGTHFTDLLLEDGPDAQPAPWDNYWNGTANGDTDNRLMPAGN